MANTVWGSTNKPASARRLAQILDGEGRVGGTLYIGYPVLGTPNGAFPFDALLLSPDFGAIAFDIVEGKITDGYQKRQDLIYSKLQSKLLQYESLVAKRRLRPNITIITYALIAPKCALDSDYPVLSDSNIIEYLVALEREDPAVYPALAAAIQAITNIRSGKRRRIQLESSSRGGKLQRLNDSIANLDPNQSAAVVETVEGVQRIRGLAGSGKTIVLALKVAYLHAQNPEWKIGVTFNTRSLKGQFERLITAFVIEQTSEQPDWDNINILHSWGSPSSDGVYYRFCKSTGVLYRDLRSARQQFGEEKEFDGACAEALKLVKFVKPEFDAILVDEAQDIPSSFLRLCYSMLSEPKRLVYAYDELQSLTDTSLPGPEELFGIDANKRALVEFLPHTPGQPRQDIILERCYRNSRPLLATAHALGFGIYRKPGGLIQIFEQNNLWLDVGYRVHDGMLEDGAQVSLERTPDTSPKFLEEHSELDDLIQFHAFDSQKDQDDWLVNAISENIKKEEMNAEDIVVINPNPLTTRKVVGNARAALFSLDIESSIAGVSNSPDIFFEPNTVTFSGVFRAKGNEAGMVYIINANDCYHSPYPAYLSRIRNRLFTAITRSKAWVRVLGVGPDMLALKAEYDRIKAQGYRLDFQYPTEERKKELRIVNRDLTRAERGKVTKKVREVGSVIAALEAGEVRVEDLPEAMRKRLRAYFGS